MATSSRPHTVSRPQNLWHTPGVPSFLEDLYRGTFRWDLIHPFPVQDGADQQAGDRVLAAFGALLRERVDPTEVDVSQRLPTGLLDALVAGGYTRLQADPELGGLGLSSMNTFRIVQAAASWSMPVAQLLSVQNTIGVGSYLPALPPGPLRDTISARVRGGVISGNADTEPAGAANRRRMTIATPIEGGAAYLLNGQKVFTGNGPVAGMVNVTATVQGPDRDRVRVFFVDTSSPGFSVSAHHEFMGLKGFPAGALTFDNVRVPAELVMVEEEHNRRLTPELSRLIIRGRVHTIAGPSLAFGKLCLHWSREFANRRQVDDRPLGSFEEIQRMVSATLSEVFALETLAQWCLLGEDARDGERAVNLRYEQVAAKNLSSMTCWRMVDRTMSLLGAEGYESAQSKARRGAQPLPVERAFREARGLRISGGVDFQIDNWTSQVGIFWCYYPEPENARAIESEQVDVSCLDDADLTEPNLDHLRFTAHQVKAFARTCLALARRHPDPQELFAQEHLLIQLNQVASELLLMSLVLARTSRYGRLGPDSTQELADLYCAAARRRIDDLWRRITVEQPGEHASASAAWLAGDRWAHLMSDVLTETPPTAS
ncbi:acyl-CoA dehydrogenase [Streptomyces inhibens]|uniref:Acyl-CoA dehydrogenase n=1 Tax=Streptomyces inhibens TaxID=2293571 RepID=A0A371PZ33_STRIH|nr:acyl-CoA dehydrogenase family protein [Streptomyces inhibens]REK87679.1 acyl-CoA dehydrogenase [Streptomyces inhibens]